MSTQQCRRQRCLRQEQGRLFIRTQRVARFHRCGSFVVEALFVLAQRSAQRADQAGGLGRLGRLAFGHEQVRAERGRDRSRIQMVDVRRHGKRQGGITRERSPFLLAAVICGRRRRLVMSKCRIRWQMKAFGSMQIVCSCRKIRINKSARRWLLSYVAVARVRRCLRINRMKVDRV